MPDQNKDAIAINVYMERVLAKKKNALDQSSAEPINAMCIMYAYRQNIHTSANETHLNYKEISTPTKTSRIEMFSLFLASSFQR